MASIARETVASKSWRGFLEGHHGVANPRGSLPVVTCQNRPCFLATCRAEKKRRIIDPWKTKADRATHEKVGPVSSV